MHQTVEKVFFALLRFEFGRELLQEEKNLITDEILLPLYKLAKTHDLAHMIGDALDKNGLLKEGSQAKKHFLHERSVAVYRYEQQRYEFELICDIFEKEKIAFIPLKGSITREYYPQAWMRTSCDIDILVKDEEKERAKLLLIEKLNYRCGDGTSHDISLYSASGVNIELHYGLIEDFISKQNESVLSDIWQQSALQEQKTCFKKMSNELFYFYHIAHMAKHFQGGGCGVRTILDVWVLNNSLEFEADKLADLFKKGGLAVFENKCRQLSNVWFGEETEHTSTTAQMSEYIISGGAYGTVVNRVSVQQQKKKGKFRYALSRIFLPYSIMKSYFPILQKHKWLTPFFEVYRWLKLIFGGKIGSSVKELKYNNSITDEQAQKTQEFLIDIGLMDK